MTDECTRCLPSRRNVLTGALAAAGLVVTDSLGSGPEGPVVSRLSFSSAAQAATVSRDVLVVLSFRGGFDGLSAVTPLNDPRLADLRPSIAIPRSALIALDDRFGMHPAMAPLFAYYRAGKVAFVQDVGQADPTRSHFAAMAEMERAAPSTSIRTGWLDRAVGAHGAGTALQAVQMGDLSTSAALTGPNPEFSLYGIDDFSLQGAWDDTERQRWSTALTAMHEGAGVPPALAASARRALSAVGTITRIDAAPTSTRSTAAYPVDGEGEPTHLARAFRDVARLVKANVGLQVACIDYGDWDMHTDLGTVDAGWMRDKLTEVAATLAAFARDLGSRLDDVTTVTMSEFGRRVEENGSGGVDHGHGNLVMLMGGGVVGGRVHGTWRGLSDDVLADGDLPGTTDYRVVLAEILEKRCRTPGVRTAVFPGLGSSRLGVVRVRG